MAKKTHYEKNIIPLAQDLCKGDDKNEEMTFGQSKEILSELKIIFKKNPKRLFDFLKYVTE